MTEGDLEVKVKGLATGDCEQRRDGDKSVDFRGNDTEIKLKRRQTKCQTQARLNIPENYLVP